MKNSWDKVAFSARLREVINGQPVARFAKKCEIAEGMLRKYLRADSIPGADKLVRVAEVGGVNLHWLATGRGAKESQVDQDFIAPSQVAVVLEFERYAQRQSDIGMEMLIQAFVDEYNNGLLDIGQVGGISQISEEELILWRDLVWERQTTNIPIDETILQASLEITDELLNLTGKKLEPTRKAKLITAIYQLNAATEGGIERSILLNLLKSLP
ncbi:MAG: helix-turn-helix domain containing protein [Candidatus Polarisedimenticolaceae bacterium]|nr:helix-turn-helix domain containing protein [Candidatus Polarisedimenticolaceae bacterium]